MISRFFAGVSGKTGEARTGFVEGKVWNDFVLEMLSLNAW